MKQQFTNALSLVDSKNVKAVLNSSQWLEESKRHNNEYKIARFVIDRLEKGIFTEVAVKERLDQAKTSSEFDDYYNSIHSYDEGEVIDLCDLIDNVNYWFAQFIAGDMAASLIPSEYKHVLETYTFFIK